MNHEEEYYTGTGTLFKKLPFERYKGISCAHNFKKHHKGAEDKTVYHDYSSCTF